MIYKVQWLIDGVLEVEEESPEKAENQVKDLLTDFVNKHSDSFQSFGAIAIQGTVQNEEENKPDLTN
tara:strand:- start:661 stop:861 length:201 start_codon:yes stop_codon:yes gene_type:complete